MIRKLFSSVSRLARHWAYRRQGRDQPPLTLHRRRIYILPTRFGLGLAVLVMAMILAAMNYANSMGFALSFTLAGLGVVCMHHTHRGLNRLVVRPGKAGRGFAGEPQYLAVQLDNPAPIPRRDILLTDERGRILDFTDLAPHGQARLALPVTPERRGPVQVRRFGLATAYPMGLFRAWCWLDMPLEGLAWPKPQSAPMQRAQDPEAETGKRSQSGTEDFAQLRDYAKGDPTRRIAWRHYLARGELIVKEFASPAGESPVWLDWQQSGGGDLESRLARLCHWVLQAEAEAGPWGLRLPDETIGPGRGQHQTRQALDALARFGLSGETASHD